MNQKTIIYGKNPLKEAIKAKRKIEKVYLSSNDQSITNLLQKEKIKYVVINTKEMTNKFGPATQGVVAEVEPYRYQTLENVLAKTKDKLPFLVMLDGLEDPHNFGAIIRSAEACGIDGIIIPKNRSVGLNATVVKVSTGAIEYVDIIEVTNLVRTLEDLKSKGFWIIGADMDGPTDFREQDYQMPIVLVIGSEGKGISRLVKETCDFLVNIPMYGQVNSLNASVSAGILFYEVVRKRATK
jgi:23S rRNA (guanosine2251-2'-O)-methyltransferase